MTDRTELLEAALDSRSDGIALLGAKGEVMFWNRAAEAITGYARTEMSMSPIPRELESLLDAAWDGDTLPGSEPQLVRRCLVHTRHKLGHEVSVLSQVKELHDALGERIGTAVVFHPAGSLDALPHGEASDNARVATSQIEMEDRLAGEFDDFAHGGPPFGVLWIMVDQAHELRKTHGVGACESMFEKVQRTLALGLRPTEELGRWGEDEFLVISHERTPEMLAAHAQMLAGLARTTDFRWWGDRVSITVSIGAAQADIGDTLAQLLQKAQSAMFSSIHAGGNHISSVPGE